MDFWYRLSKRVIGAYLAAFVKKIHVVGEENLPPGPKIIMANHAHLSDGFVLPFVIREKLHFLIQGKSFDHPFLRFLLSKADQIPVMIGRAQEALQTSLDRLSMGHAIAIFPEGKLNYGQKLHRGRLGAALLAIRSGAPIVPVGFYVPPEFTKMLTARIQSQISKTTMQIRGACYVCIGKPWSVLQPNDGELHPRLLRDLTDKIMSNIEDLIGQARAEAQRS